MVLDEIVAFATDSGSSTHHTQSPNHNLTPITTQPDLTSPPQPNQPPPHTRLHVTQPRLHTTSYSHPHQDIPSIYTQTLTRSIVNKLLTLYIPIDILTFI